MEIKPLESVSREINFNYLTKLCGLSAEAANDLLDNYQPKKECPNTDWLELEEIAATPEFQCFIYALRWHQYELSKAARESQVSYKAALEWKRIFQIPAHQDWLRKKRAFLPLVAALQLENGMTRNAAAKRYGVSPQALARHASQGRKRIYQEISGLWRESLLKQGYSQAAAEFLVNHPTESDPVALSKGGLTNPEISKYTGLGLFRTQWRVNHAA